jgi:hypothetical protein
MKKTSEILKKIVFLRNAIFIYYNIDYTISKYLIEDKMYEYFIQKNTWENKVKMKGCVYYSVITDIEERWNDFTQGVDGKISKRHFDTLNTIYKMIKKYKEVEKYFKRL